MRLRVARAVQRDNNAVAIAERDAVLSAVGDKPAARGCVLRDRGWSRLDADQLEGALSDLIESHNLLMQHADRDEQMVALGRLSVAYVRGGDHVAALRLVDESVPHFRSSNAAVRLTTALSRHAAALTYFDTKNANPTEQLVLPGGATVTRAEIIKGFRPTQRLRGCSFPRLAKCSKPIEAANRQAEKYYVT